MKFFFIALLLLTELICHSQTPSPSLTCLVDNGLCSYNLSDTSSSLPFSTVGQDLGISYGKYNAAPNYPGDVKYADENDDCTNTSSGCILTDNGVLRYDVYYPVVAFPSTCPLPCVIYVHGGGFSDCNVLGTNGNNKGGIAFAKRGFIFINVEYRSGRRVSPDKPAYPYTTVQQQLAIYRAVQDVIGAIRTIIQRQREQWKLAASQRKPYQIDTNYLFLGGNSAGAITALGVAYYSRQSMVDSLNPQQGNFSISQALGPINADYYYGATDVEFRSKIKGVLAQWGSLSVPNNYDSTTAKNFFDQRIPVICFHGLQDPVVRPYITPVNFAPVDNNPITNYKDTYNVVTTCILTPSFKTNGGLPSPDSYTYGSLSYFRNILQPLGIRREEYVDCDAKHGLDPNGPNFKSDYGIGDPLTDHSTVDDVNLYIVGRGATFFQSIIGGGTAPGHKIFYECRNNRITCTQGNNDAGCNNADDCGSHPHQ